MKFFKKLGILIYLVIMLVAGSFFIVTASGVIDSATWGEFISLISESVDYQMTVGAFGVIVVLVGLTTAVKASKKLSTSKLITFQNPDGEVTISLSAIEAYVHRVAKDIPGIKDVKSCVNVNKKGINIKSYVSIAAGTNIPEATEIIQMTVKDKVHDMLGVEENINITMHINKILKGSESTEDPYEESEEEVQVPHRELD